MALFGVFLGLISVTPVIRHSITEAPALDGLRGFDGVEQTRDENGNLLSYSWTRADATLSFRNLPRYASLELSLDLSLARPANAPPARLELFLQADSGQLTPLANYQFEPARPGFNRYQVIIPPGTPPGQPGFTLLLKSNGFPAGDGRELGVRLAAFEVRALTGWRALFVWPNPYAIAVGLLLFGLFLWVIRLGLGWAETLLLAAPLSFAAAESAQYLQARSGWLLLFALLFGLAALTFKWDRLGAARQIGPILAAILALIAFLVGSWPAVYDTHFYLDWLNDVSRYGPFGLYSHSPNLNYPPLIIYLLWLYGLVANPLGLANSYTAVKLLLSLAVPLLVLVVWGCYHKRLESGKLSPILFMMGVSMGALYNPVVYGQSDAPLGLLLVACALAIKAGRAKTGGVLLALSFLYKLQTVYLAPLLLVLMLKRSGGRQTALGLGLGLAVALGLALPAFGFSADEFGQYWNQGQLAGEGQLEYGAFNVLDLLNANNGQSGWIVPLGFGLIGLVYLALVARIWVGKAGEAEIWLACGLAILVCFVFGIKVKQHYLYYPLPFLGLAALFDRRILKPWLLLGGVYTLMLIVSPVLSRRGVIFDNFLAWNRLLKVLHGPFEDGLAWAALLLFLYLLTLCLWLWKKRPITK